MDRKVTPELLGHFLNAPGQTTASPDINSPPPSVGIKSPERRVVWLQRLAGSFLSGTVNVTVNTAVKFPLSSSLPLFVSLGKSLSKGIYSPCISGAKRQPPSPPSLRGTAGSGDPARPVAPAEAPRPGAPYLPGPAVPDGDGALRRHLSLPPGTEFA